MIALSRKRDGIPAKYRGAGLKKAMATLLEAFYANAGEVPFNQQKNLQIWTEAKPNLKLESHDKCAYCEAPTSAVTFGDVEHFRPKSSYWWLAYSYDNYAFACQMCNQAFKGDQFTVRATKLKTPVELPSKRPDKAKLEQLAAQLCPDPAATSPASLRTLWKGEKATLPHPYLELPEALLAWQVDDINQEVTVVPVPGSSASKIAVKACEKMLGINREELRRMRYPQYDRAFSLALVVQEGRTEAVRQMAKTRLAAAARDDQPFAGMTRFFMRQWGVLD
jgi:uncharacterized protein (TIGR02646 family)